MRRDIAAGLIAIVLIIAAAVSFRHFQAPARAAESREPDHSVLLYGSRSWTAACLRDRVLALLDIGERDAGVINALAVKRCGANLTFYLANELDRPNAEVEAYMRAHISREVAALMKERP